MLPDTQKQLHIEGLRCLAILAIILFHLCPETFPTGFLGVEVFLVITGYLLFAKPFRRGEETLREASGRFLGKKVKRLLIPTAALVVFTMLLCFCFLTPEDYRLCAITGLFSMVGGSNFYLHKIVKDYFSVDVSYCPLTHTWYLAVIIQLYLLYWLSSLVCNKAPKAACRAALAVVALVSLAWANSEGILRFLQGLGCEYYLNSTPDYYGVSGRLWEVLAGAAIPLLPDIKNGACRTALSVAALLALACLLAQNAELERSTSMMAAVLCTVVLVRYAAQGPIGKLLSLKAAVKVGALSFSLYLVHFPIIVCYHCVANANGAAGLTVVAILIAVAGWLFYRYVETRRFGRVPSMALAGAGLALAALGVAAPNSILWRETNLKTTEYSLESVPAPESFYKGFDASAMPIIYDVEIFMGSKKKCRHSLVYVGEDKAENVSFALIGDSHAASLCMGMDMQCRRHGLSGLHVKTYVVPFSRWEFSRWDGKKENALLHWLAEHPELKTVVIAQSWMHRIVDDPGLHPIGTPRPTMEDGLREFINKIRALDKQVILVASALAIKSKSLIRDYRLGHRSADFAPRRQLLVCTREEYDTVNERSRTLLHQLEDEGLCRILHTERSTFDDNGVFEGVKDGHRYMHDWNHVSPEGAEKMLEGCMEDFKQWVRK